MKTRIALTLTALVLVFALAACAPKQEAAVDSPRFETAAVKAAAPSATPAVVTVPQTGTVNWDDYADVIAAEEDFDEELAEVYTVSAAPVSAGAGTAATAVPESGFTYAGATPLVIDPIDKPTPTPVPAMSFSEYATYDATKLRLSFEAPKGWDVDDSLSDTYVLTNPDNRFPYQAQLMVTARAVSSEYGVNDLKKEVLAVVNNLKSEFTGFSKTNTANRTLFDKNGVYIDFDGTIKGTEYRVWGRVHAVTVNKTLVVVRVTAPYEYARTYKDGVYSRFRKTVKFTK